MNPVRRGALAVLVINQLLAGVGVSAGIAVAALLVQDLTGATLLAGFAQTSSVLGAGLSAIPLARIAINRGRHAALGIAYTLSFVGAGLILIAASSRVLPLVFVGLAAFGVSTAAGLQARFAATEIARPGYEARWMSLVLWATTLGSVTGPNLADVGDTVGRALGLPALVGSFLFGGVAFAVAGGLALTVLRLPPAGQLLAEKSDAVPEVQPVVGSQPAPRGQFATQSKGISSWQAFRIATRNPTALLALLAIVCAHTVMVSVMVMTPIHMHDHGLSLP